MSIVNNCFVVSLHVNMWTGHRLDKAASTKVTQEAGAEEGAARVNKHLISKSDLTDITRTVSALKAFYYSKTLPWKDNGDRLLVRKQYHAVMLEFEKMKKEFDNAVEDFCTNKYPAARASAEFRMGKLFKEDEYPSVAEIRYKFGCRLELDAVTTAQDFRVSLDASEMERLQKEAEAAMERRIATAMGDVWGRLARALETYTDRLRSDGRLYGSTVEGLKEVVEILPDLNILNDPNLARIGQEIRNRIAGYDVEQIREDKVLRNQLADEAAQIMADMSGFMNAMKAAA